MTHLIYMFIIQAMVLIALTDASAQKKEKHRFVPDHAKCQFVGNMGFLSFGAGYTFYGGKLQLDLFYGFVDNNHSYKDIHHITQKNTIFPVTLAVNDKLTWTPLSLGTHFSYKVGKNNYEMWLFLPKRYPRKYYFSTSFHVLMSMGSKVNYKLNSTGRVKEIDFYIEAGTVDLYLRNCIQERFVKFTDVISFDMGLTAYCL